MGRAIATVFHDAGARVVATDLSKHEDLGSGIEYRRYDVTSRVETDQVIDGVLDGEGTTEIAGHRFDWRQNDLFVIPNFLWRRHINRGRRDAVLYLCSDRPLFEKIGQYRAQGRTPAGDVVQLV